MSEILLQDYVTFTIIDLDVNLFQCENEYGNHITAEIDNKFFYLGDKDLNMQTAIAGWKLYFKKLLTEDEMEKFLIEYNIG